LIKKTGVDRGQTPVKSNRFKTNYLKKLNFDADIVMHVTSTFSYAAVKTPYISPL